MDLITHAPGFTPREVEDTRKVVVWDAQGGTSDLPGIQTIRVVR